MINFFLCFFISLSLILLLIYYLPVVLALSPSFERAITYDNIGDIDTIDQTTIENSFYPSDLPFDIKEVTYTSDGENFNATLWLMNPIYETDHLNYAELNLTFYMLIDIPLLDGTIDDAYVISIYPEKDGTWTKKVVEWEPSDSTQKILDLRKNYSGFYENGKSYVDLSLGLKNLGYPDKYRVSFYTHVDDYRGMGMLEDWSPWDTIPPGHVLITYDWPAPAKIRVGEYTDLSVAINAFELNEQENITMTDANITDKIKLFFDPPSTITLINGTTVTKMTIFVQEDLDVTNKINFQTVNITSRLYNESSQKTGDIAYNSSEFFNAELLPPFSISEKINNSLNNFLINYYGIYIIPLGITSIFASILSRRVDTESIVKLISISDLLTLNGSIIAGVLIFLTLGGTGFIEVERFWQIGILTASIVYPFALSAIVTLTTGSIEKGVKFIIPGFVYLMVSIVLIILVDVQI